MADCMMFPNDWHDFIKDYSFIDSEQVYTNGSELIQVFRVIQLIEHLLKEQEAKNVVNMTLSKDCFLIASCPKCNALLTRVEHKNYCGYCGQAVKWE